MIRIGHLNKADVLAALFNNARTRGLAGLHYKPEHVMDRKEAQSLIDDELLTFDYLEGRVLKIDLRTDEFEPWLYDRDNGEGAAQMVIDTLTGG